MKRLTIITLIFLIIFSNCKYAFSQKREIIYDFKSKNLSIPANIVEKDNVFIKVSGINQYLFKVELAAKNKEFNKAIPKLIQQFIPDETTDVSEGTLKKVLGLFTTMDAADTEKTLTVNFSALKDKIINLLSKDKVLYAKTLKILNPKYVYNVNDNITDVELRGLFEAINEFEKEYSNLVSRNTNDAESKILTNIKAIYDSQGFLSKHRKYSVFSYNFGAENFSFTSAPIIAQPDEMEFSLRLSPRTGLDSLLFMPLNSDSIRFKIRVKRASASISFSSGIFVSSLYNESYTYTPNFKANSKIDIDNYTLKAEDINKSTVGLNSMVHFMKDFDFMTAGLHLGFGIPVEKKLNIYAFYGISVSFGAKERILLNIGRVNGLINMLSNAVKLDQQFKDTKSEILYTRTLAGGWSASLTFNFYSR